jgi:hypothetical protein
MPLKPGTLARELYGKDVVSERHRHRYEFNNRYRTQLEDLGLVISGKSMDDLLVEMIELPQPPVVHGLPGASRNSCRRRATGIRCSSASSAPRASTRPARGTSGGGVHGSIWSMKLCRISRSAWTAAVPDRRPCVIERAVAA